MRKVGLAFVLVWGLLAVGSIGGYAQQQPQGMGKGARLKGLDARALRAALDKSRLSPVERKISSSVRALVSIVSARGADRRAVIKTHPSVLSNPFQRVDDAGMVQLYVESAGDPNTVAATIAKVGGKVEVISREMSLVQCWVPYDQVHALGASPVVRNIRLPAYARTRTGTVNSEGDVVHRCDKARSMLGLTGSGIKVGIISDGIYKIELSQESGDIPATFEARSARADGDLYAGAEGLAMMEIVHDLAPGAALAFSNCLTSVEMLKAIDILDRTFHCNALCDDLGFGDEPFFEDGPMVARINQAVQNGAIYASAAGNAGDRKYYEGVYSGVIRNIAGVSMNVQDFGSGDWNLDVDLPVGGFLEVVLQWDDPWGRSKNDYDLLLTDATGTTVYESATDVQDGNDNPVEQLWFINTGTAALYHLVVRRTSGSGGRLKMETEFSAGTFLEHYTAAGSIYGHPAGSNAIACGAVDQRTPDVVEPFSSQGPVALRSGARNKPDVCGADDVMVTGNGGFPTPFFGTSAAAPHVAAICALVWSADRSRSNSKVRDLLEKTAVDLLAGGYDTISGYGRADALRMALMPDLMIRNAGEGSASYAADNVYNNIARQTKWQKVANGVTATYSVKVQNDGIATGTYTLTGDAGDPDWTIDYYAGGRYVTSEVTGAAGWKTPPLAGGSSVELRLEVTPRSSARGGSARQVRVGVALTGGQADDAVMANTEVETAYQPDLMVRTPEEGEKDYALNDLYNLDGYRQTKSQTVVRGVPATYVLRLQNDGNLSDRFRVLGTAGGSGWQVSYFDALTGGNNLTTQVTGSGWTTAELEPQAFVEFRAEVEADSSAADGSMWAVLVKAVSLGDPSNPPKADLVKAETTLPVSYQPDLMIRKWSERDTDYLAPDVYSTTGLNQTKEDAVPNGQWARYALKVLSHSTGRCTFIIIGNGGDSGWTVKYFDALSGQTDITTLVTGGGWAIDVAPGGSKEFRVEVRPESAAGVTVPAWKDVITTAFATRDRTKQDTVKARTTKTGAAPSGWLSLAPLAWSVPPPVEMSVGETSEIRWIVFGSKVEATWVQYALKGDPVKAPEGKILGQRVSDSTYSASFAPAVAGHYYVVPVALIDGVVVHKDVLECDVGL